MMDLRDELLNLVTSYPNHYGKMLRGKPELLKFVQDFQGKEIKEQVYVALNGVTPHLCKQCQAETPFISVSAGYREYCNATCQNLFLKDARKNEAIAKLNAFGNLTYISGYDGSHSKVRVKNEDCGCTFDATYLNLFTNPNYCPVHGKEVRTEKLIKRNELGLTEEAKQKRKLTFQKIHEERVLTAKHENEDLEKSILAQGRAFLNEFIQEMSDQYRSKLEKVISRFPVIHKMINDHYGDRFGQKVYNLINNVDSIHQHPKCVECSKIVNYRSFSNSYHEFCSIACKSKSADVAERTKNTMIKNHGVPYPMQNREILRKMWHSSFRLKDVILPSGKVIHLMGYEPQVLNYLLTVEEFQEDDFEFVDIPVFKYDNHGKTCYYLPDFFLPSANTIIEVKSKWTFEIEKEVNLLKAEAVRSAGYEYRLIIWCDRSNAVLN